jgi:glycosyltransferase involved in cell wall biosynthesis
VSVAVAGREPRVLLLSDYLTLGGIARIVVSMASGLRARGLDVRVAHLGIGAAHPLARDVAASGTPPIDLAIGSLLNPRVIARLTIYLRRERIDLVHTHARYSNLVGRAAAVLARRPVVSTIHDIVETETGWRAGVRRRLDYLSARLVCSRVIALCETQRQVYQRWTGLDSGRIEIHRNGVDTALFRPDPLARARLRQELGLTPDQPLFVTVASLRPGKGLEYLLRAAVQIKRQAPAVRFAIAGEGDERARLEALASSLGLGASVRFLGARRDVPALLAAADALVHPSLYEALPTSVLEAMAVGLPVLATNVGGIPEIVAHGRTGLLAPPERSDELAAALIQLLNPELRAALGTAGRAWVETHASSEAWLDGLQALYRRVARADGAGDRGRC